MENEKDMKLYIHDFELGTSKLFFDAKGLNYCFGFSPDDSRLLAKKVISSSHTELYLVSNIDQAFDDISQGISSPSLLLSVSHFSEFREKEFCFLRLSLSYYCLGFGFKRMLVFEFWIEIMIKLTLFVLSDYFSRERNRVAHCAWHDSLQQNLKWFLLHF